MESEMSWARLHLAPVQYKNHSHLSYISPEPIRAPYAFSQVEKGAAAGFLKAEITPYAESVRIFYDIHGYTSLAGEDLSNLNYEDWRNLLTDLLTVVQDGFEHLLEGEHMVLDPEYVYLSKSGRRIGLLYVEGYFVPFEEGMRDLAGWFLAHHHPKEDKSILLFYHFYHRLAADADVQDLIRELKTQVYLEREEELRRSVRLRVEGAVRKAESDGKAREDLQDKLRRMKEEVPVDYRKILWGSAAVFTVSGLFLTAGPLFGLFEIGGKVIVFFCCLMVLSLFSGIVSLTRK